MRCTEAMRPCSSAETISRAGDFRGSGLRPSQTDSITSPVTRSASPLAMVSTSGSSGMKHQCTGRAMGRLTASEMFIAEDAEIAEIFLFLVFIGVLSALGGEKVWLPDAS